MILWPFHEIEFVPGSNSVAFSVGVAEWFQNNSNSLVE